MRWIAGGIAGWLAAVLPLLGVNIAGYANVFDTETAVVAGASALIGGILLGGLVTGLIAGRSSGTRAGGATTALPAGSTAGLLYAISLVAVVMVAIRTNAAPAVVVEHPVRITVAIFCLGAILLGISLLVGMVVGRRGGTPKPQPQTQAATRYQAQQGLAHPQASVQPRYGQNPSQPTRGEYPSNANQDYREPGNRSNQRDYNGQTRGYSGYESDYGERQPARYPSGPSASHSGRDTRRDDERDDDWRENRR